MKDVEFKKTCIELRKKGLRLSQIIEATGRSKTSIYFHIKDIPLSEKTITRIKKESGERIRKFAIARKGKSTRTFNRFEKWTPELVLLIAHLSFDGDILRGVCSYNNRNNTLIERVVKLMVGLYSFMPARYVNKTTGVMRVAYHNVELSAYLHEKSQELLRVITTLTVAHKKEFLRAFFDDEGCMDFRPERYKRSVRGYQKNKKILTIIKELLNDLGITAHLEEPNEVVISGRADLSRFQEMINFSDGVEVNGNRTNSTWKKNIEKKELLNRALKSYIH